MENSFELASVCPYCTAFVIIITIKALEKGREKWLRRYVNASKYKQRVKFSTENKSFSQLMEGCQHVRWACLVATSMQFSFSFFLSSSIFSMGETSTDRHSKYYLFSLRLACGITTNVTLCLHWKNVWVYSMTKPHFQLICCTRRSQKEKRNERGYNAMASKISHPFCTWFVL